MTTTVTNGGCFRNALLAAETNKLVKIPYDLFIPDWLSQDQVGVICKCLDLRWHGPDENIWMGVEPAIVIYRNAQGRGHAIFTQDVGPLFYCGGILGVVRFGKEQR